MKRKILAIFLAVTLLFAFTSCNNEEPTAKIKNVILLIGDGMGPNQIKMGEYYKGSKLNMQTITNRTSVETSSLNSTVTDSAASSTAMATGKKTYNGYVGVSPTGEEYSTIVDKAKSYGKKTGVITTEALYGATPMGFSGHSLARGNTDSLMYSAATSSNVDLFLSCEFATSFQYCLDYFTGYGYEKIENASDISDSEAEKIIGTFNILASATSMDADDFCVAFDRLVFEALEYLSKNEEGFFLMAEGAHIDHGGHANDIMYMLEELLAFDDAVKVALDWAKDRKDTLVLVTADHETGGLLLSEDINKDNYLEYSDGEYLNFYWSTTGHTSKEVYLYAYGAKINFLNYSSFRDGQLIANTDIIKIMDEFLSK